MNLQQALQLVASLIPSIPIIITSKYIIKNYKLKNKLLELEIKEKEKAFQIFRKG